MKKARIVLITLFYLLSVKILPAQNNFYTSSDTFQYGIATKLQIEIGTKKIFSRTAYKFSISSGILYDIEAIGVAPAFHIGLLLFNKGSNGANQSLKWKTVQSHFYTSMQATVKLDERDFNFEDRSVPLYHFSEFNANPLQNPYKSSFTYGANWIFVQDGKKQRIGFFNVNIVGRGQISYYNDGGPVLKWVGDKRDRYYTGGIVLSYHGAINDPVNLVELSYHKYTGYQKYAFDVADKLQIDFLNYYDSEQFCYNQQRWRLNISNLNNGYGGSMSVYNNNSLDVQDLIHFNTNVPYHPDYSRESRWMFGARYEYNYTGIPQ